MPNKIPDPPLQPCPFCGSEALLQQPWENTILQLIGCTEQDKQKCPIAGIRMATKPELWNKRADVEVF